MIKTFRADKMINRVKREGRGNLLDKETLAKIMSLDGKSGTDYNWRSQVYGEDLVYIHDGNGGGEYVAACDCD